jgi:hypothetical protein
MPLDQITPRLVRWGRVEPNDVPKLLDLHRKILAV